MDSGSTMSVPFPPVGGVSVPNNSLYLPMGTYYYGGRTYPGMRITPKQGQYHTLFIILIFNFF